MRSPGNREAFQLLYLLFQMAVSEVPHRRLSSISQNPCDFCHLRGIGCALLELTRPQDLGSFTPRAGLSCRIDDTAR